MTSARSRGPCRQRRIVVPRAITGGRARFAPRQLSESLREQPLVGLRVAGGDREEVIGLTGDEMALVHVVGFGDGPLERLERLLLATPPAHVGTTAVPPGLACCESVVEKEAYQREG